MPRQNHRSNVSSRIEALQSRHQRSISHNTVTERTATQPFLLTPTRTLPREKNNNRFVAPTRMELQKLVSARAPSDTGTSPFASVIHKLLTKRNRECTSGVVHWKKFRLFCDRQPTLLKSEDVNSVMTEFISYLMTAATKIECHKTVDKYVTQVKMWHGQLHQFADTPNNACVDWPETFSARYHSFNREAKRFYLNLVKEKEFNRVPTTSGLLQFLAVGENGLGGTWNINDWFNSRLWATELIGIFAGTRKGELLVKTQNPSARNTLKDFHVRDVTINSESIQLWVFGKASLKRESALILREEVEPIVKRFGKHFDIFRILKEILDSASSPDDLVFCHTNGKPITYNQYWPVITDVCKRAKVPKGSTGGHGGRNRLATLMAIKNYKDIYIKGRGRWTSVCWETYVRTCANLLPPSSWWFRLGDLNLDLRGYPDASEFRK